MLTWTELRERRGLSQAALAARAGVSISAIYTLEKGKRRPQMANRVALVEALIDAASLDDDEAEFLTHELDLDHRVLQKIQRDMTGRSATAKDAPRERIHREVDRLIDEHGVDRIRQAMLGLVAALSMLRDEETRDGSTPRVVVGPPQRKSTGRRAYTEHVETEYVEQPTAPPAKPARRARPG